jgi:hypothetical protein
LVEDDTDEALWRPDGWCSIAQAEKWTVEVMFSAGEAEEDLSPGKDKLRMVEGGAELRQTENIRARVTRRLDGAGSVCVGSHRPEIYSPDTDLTLCCGSGMTFRTSALTF